VRFLFASHVLDTDRRELRRGSEQISVGPQVFDLLVYLLQNRERVVSKDDLLDVVWRRRIVSESTLTSHINAARKAIGDTGEEQRLIRTVPRKGFRFVGEVQEAQASGDDASSFTHSDQAAKLTPALTTPDKPSIAVLPFQSLSRDPEQQYFADGVVEDIIMALSRVRWLFVIARNSSFTYKDRAVDVKQIGRELGVRYVVEGSVRKEANRVRIAGQLIDASTGAHLWADRFEGTVDDIFDLQDRVTASVVGAISPKLEEAEIERAKRKPTESLDAYDYYLRAMASFYQRSKEGNDEALRLFYKAIELDPTFASAYGMAAWCYAWRKMNGWMTDGTQESAEAVRLAKRAVELGKDDAVALARGGDVLAFVMHDLDASMALLDRAVMLNPNFSVAWYMSGWKRAYRGELNTAVDNIARAMRLSPLDPTQYHMQIGMAFAQLLLGRHDEACSWVEKAFRIEPNYLPGAAIAAASYALAGRTAEARYAMEHVRQIAPELRMSNLREWIPLRRPQDFAKWADGLRKAGLPE
jgi:TolB-like protein/tetratricopeptide (TPR) repeat protein